MKNSIIIYITLLSVTLFTASCKKKSTPTDTIVPKGTFVLHLHSNIDTNEVEAYDSVYMNAEGRSISLTMAQMYISNIQFVKLDGTTYDIPTSKFLKVLDIEEYSFENIPVGNYKAIRFKVGLDANTNILEPSSSALFNHSSMWFSSVVQPDGYVFMNVQGTIDTSAAMNTAAVPFSYKIGTNSNLVTINMPDQNFSIIKNEKTLSHIIIDYSKIFTGIQLNQLSNLSVVLASENGNSTAAIIKNNISHMFSFE